MDYSNGKIYATRNERHLDRELRHLRQELTATQNSQRNTYYTLLGIVCAIVWLWELTTIVGN